MSLIETMLARVAQVLEAGLPDVQVARRRLDAWSVSDMPAIEVLRGDASSEDFGGNGDRWRPSLRLRLMVLEGSTAETDLDALWQRAHLLLNVDAQLAALCRGLRCTGTSEPDQAAAGEGVLARMDCSYESQQLIRRGDLARAIN